MKLTLYKPKRVFLQDYSVCIEYYHDEGSQPELDQVSIYNPITDLWVEVNDIESNKKAEILLKEYLEKKGVL